MYNYHTVEKDALISPDGLYRYWLSRIWDIGGPVAVFIGLNPSTADHLFDDPTITRCIRYADRWGKGGLIMLNLFAYRATDPKQLKETDDPVGPDNDKYIREWSREGLNVCCWGVHGGYLGRDKVVKKMVEDHNPQVLAFSKNGYPRHPLYLKKDLEPKFWNYESHSNTHN